MNFIGQLFLEDPLFESGYFAIFGPKTKVKMKVLLDKLIKRDYFRTSGPKCLHFLMEFPKLRGHVPCATPITASTLSVMFSLF